MQELEAKQALVPKVAGAISSAGGIFADLTAEYSVSRYNQSSRFDYEDANKVLENLEKQGEAFLERSGVTPQNRRLSFYVEAHYPFQIWELSVPLRGKRISNEKELNQLVDDFHEIHERVYAVTEPGQYIECIYWRVKATGIISKPELEEMPLAGENPSAALVGKRKAYFRDLGGMVETPIYRGDKLISGNKITAPAIIEEPTTTVVVPPESTVTVTKLGSYLLKLD